MRPSSSVCALVAAALFLGSVVACGEDDSEPVSACDLPEPPARDDDILADAPRLEVVWETSGALWTFSSPRAADLNGDCILDVVLGHGALAGDSEQAARDGYVTAHDGRTGEELWRADATHEMFTSATPMELTGSAPIDFVVGGRDARLLAIDGSDGSVLWRFYPDRGGRDDGWFNFYTPQPFSDVDGDSIDDLVVANGGDAYRLPFEERPEGHLMVLSGADGAIVASAPMPDGGETYMSALVFEPGDGRDTLVIFGSGGETLPGSLWIAPVADLLDNDLSDAVELVSPTSTKGMIAVPALADLTGDGIVDIVAATFDGRLIALNEASFEVFWTVSVDNAETYSTPAIGDFDGDDVPDVFASFAIGEFPNYGSSRHVMVSGDSGELLGSWDRPEGYVASPIAVDIDEDGLDEVIASGNGAGLEQQRLLLIDPSDGQLVELAEFASGGASTPWVGDLDRDGVLDMIRAAQSGGNFETASWVMQRLTLDAFLVEPPAWGAYLGTDFDGVFRER